MFGVYASGVSGNEHGGVVERRTSLNLNGTATITTIYEDGARTEHTVRLPAPQERKTL